MERAYKILTIALIIYALLGIGRLFIVRPVSQAALEATTTP